LNLHSEPEARLDTLHSLWTIAMCADNQAALRAAGSVSALVTTLVLGVSAEREVAAGVLTTLAAYPDNHEDILEAGVFDTLVDILNVGASDGDTHLSLDALLLLTKHSRENRVTVRDAGAVPILVQLLLSARAEVKAKCAAVLANLSKEPDIDPEVLQARVAVSFDLLMTGTPDVQERMAAALVSVAQTAKNHKPLRDAGVVAELVRVSKEFASLRKWATALMRMLATNSDNHAQLLEHALEALLQMVLGPDMTVAENSIAALVHLMLDKHGRSAIRNAGGVRVLARMMELPTIPSVPVILEYGIKALRLLSDDLEQVTSFCEEGGIHALVRVCSFQFTAAQEIAAGILCRLAAHEETHQWIREARGIVTIVKLLDTGNANSRMVASQILKYLAVSSEQ